MGGGLIRGLLNCTNRLVGHSGHGLSNATAGGPGSGLNSRSDNASRGGGSLNDGRSDGGNCLRGLGRISAGLNDSGSDRGSDNRSLRGGGDGYSGGNLGSSRRDGYGNRSGHGGGHARIGLSRGLGDRRGSRRVLLSKLSDSLHVTGSSSLLNLLREFSGNRRVLRDGERRGKRHKGSYDKGPSFHREMRRFTWWFRAL